MVTAATGSIQLRYHPHHISLTAALPNGFRCQWEAVWPLGSHLHRFSRTADLLAELDLDFTSAIETSTMAAFMPNDRA
jgi:hypothetical protein